MAAARNVAQKTFQIPLVPHGAPAPVPSPRLDADLNSKIGPVINLSPREAAQVMDVLGRTKQWLWNVFSGRRAPDYRLIVTLAPPGHPGSLLPSLMANHISSWLGSITEGQGRGVRPGRTVNPDSPRLRSISCSVEVIDGLENDSFATQMHHVVGSEMTQSARVLLAQDWPGGGKPQGPEPAGRLLNAATDRVFLDWDAERGIAALTEEGMFDLVPLKWRERFISYVKGITWNGSPVPFLILVNAYLDTLDIVLRLGLRSKFEEALSVQGIVPWWFAHSTRIWVGGGSLGKCKLVTLGTAMEATFSKAAIRSLLQGEEALTEVLRTFTTHLRCLGSDSIHIPAWAPPKPSTPPETPEKKPPSSFTTRTEGLPSLDSIVLSDFQREELKDFTRFIKNRHRAQSELGLDPALFGPIPAVALFHGPSGTGKTMTGGAIAQELGLPHHVLKAGKTIGSTSSDVEEVLQQFLKEMGENSGLFQIDEIDSLLLRRDQQPSNGWMQFYTRIVNTFLAFLDGCTQPIIFTTNRPEALDPAVMRRIQFQVAFPEPDAGAREAIWRTLWPSALPMAGEIDLAFLAREFPFTGAEIRKAMLDACLRSLDRGGPAQMDLVESSLLIAFRASAGDAKPPSRFQDKRPRFSPKTMARLEAIVNHLAAAGRSTVQ